MMEYDAPGMLDSLPKLLATLSSFDVRRNGHKTPHGPNSAITPSFFRHQSTVSRDIYSQSDCASSGPRSLAFLFWRDSLDPKKTKSSSIGYAQSA